MKQTYIILLKNLHIKIQSKEPKKQGNYMKEVRLLKKKTTDYSKAMDIIYELEQLEAIESINYNSKEDALIQIKRSTSFLHFFIYSLDHISSHIKNLIFLFLYLKTENSSIPPVKYLFSSKTP